MRRFYSPPETFTDRAVTLGADETHHLRDVVRQRSGDEVSVFDGEGREFTCVIRGIGRTSAELEIIREIESRSPESPASITLSAAILKADKFELVIQKAVELGVAELQPLITDRCEANTKHTDKRLVRWQRIILDASKQCGRATLMKIGEPVKFQTMLAAGDNSGTVLFAERDGERLGDGRSSVIRTVVIGPEGGWSDAEFAAARASGCRIVTLGGRILRAETAAIAITAIVQNLFGDIN